MSTAMNRLVRTGAIPQYTDAKGPMYIHVTAFAVSRGQKHAPDQCVLAKSLLFALPDAVQAWFYNTAAYVLIENPKTGKRTCERYITTQECRDEIKHFDRTGKFRVGNFRIDAPSKSATLKSIAKRSKARPGRHQPAKRPRIGIRGPKAATKGRVQYAAKHI